jgi:hypothetical protein
MQVVRREASKYLPAFGQYSSGNDDNIRFQVYTKSRLSMAIIFSAAT